MNFWDIVIVIINFMGALGLFLFGMTLMSTGLQKIAGSKMRSILRKITGNPFSGILAGTVVTTLVQSSSATTVMVVSFVNAGLMSLAGAIAVIMGANIGTTVTAWIISLFGLGESGGAFSLILAAAALALCLFFSKKNRQKNLAEFIFGFAILMAGLGFLQTSMPDLQQYPKALEALASLSNWGFLSIIIFTLIGALLTCILQASAAVMAVTLVMCYNGWISFDMAVALVMGQNIGTTITANLAAMVANTNAKRAARAHLVFNVVGVILTLLVLRPELSLIGRMTESLTGLNPDIDLAGFSGEARTHAMMTVAPAVPLALSLFHTLFNVVNTFILVWFIPTIIKIVEWMVPENAEDKESEFHLTYISHGLMGTAELSIQAAEKEAADFSDLVIRMFQLLPGLRTAKTEEEFDKVFSRIEKSEALTDRLELEMTKYLTSISADDLSARGSQRVSSLLRIVDNLESIGDDIFQMAMVRKNKREDAIHFDQGLNDNLSHMTQLVQHALDVMRSNLHGAYDDINLDEAYKAEDAINKYRDVLRKRHFDALKLGVYDYAIGNAYSMLYAQYEKMGDHIINISEAIDNSKKIADNEEEMQIKDVSTADMPHEEI